MHVAESRSTLSLCNKNVGPITLQPLVIYMYIWFGLQSTVWLGHDTITTMGSQVVKGLINLITFVGMSGITVWLGLIFVGISALKGLKLTCMNESDPVLLMP